MPLAPLRYEKSLLERGVIMPYAAIRQWRVNSIVDVLGPAANDIGRDHALPPRTNAG
jgi:hypothetical protein